MTGKLGCAWVSAWFSAWVSAWVHYCVTSISLLVNSLSTYWTTSNTKIIIHHKRPHLNHKMSTLNKLKHAYAIKPVPKPVLPIFWTISPSQTNTEWKNDTAAYYFDDFDLMLLSSLLNFALTTDFDIDCVQKNKSLDQHPTHPFIHLYFIMTRSNFLIIYLRVELLPQSFICEFKEFLVLGIL